MTNQPNLIKNSYSALRGGNEIALAAFYKDYLQETILFECMIHPNHLQKFKKFPENAKKKRNILIYLTFFQIISSLFGMMYILFRRSFAYLVINFLAFCLALCGIYGSASMKSFFLLIHCIFTISFTGGFFIFEIFDFLFVGDTSYGDSRRFTDNIILLIFSLPYAFDLYVGCYCYFFLKAIAQIMKNTSSGYELTELKKKYTDEQIESYITSVNDKTCVICMEGQRNTVMNPCGHVLCCESCATSLFTEEGLLHEVKCPICRRPCRNYVKLLIS